MHGISPWDDDAGKRHWKNEVVVASLEMLSGLSTKEYAKAAQAVAEAPDGAPDANGAADESDLEPVVAMSIGRRGISPRVESPDQPRRSWHGGGGTLKRSAALIVRSRGGCGTDDAQGWRL